MQKATGLGTYTLNRPKSAKLPLEVLLVGLIREARHDQRLEGVTANIRVIIRLICDNKRVRKCEEKNDKVRKLCSVSLHFMGPSVKIVSILALCSSFLRSRISNQLSVGI